MDDDPKIIVGGYAKLFRKQYLICGSGSSTSATEISPYGDLAGYEIKGCTKHGGSKGSGRGHKFPAGTIIRVMDGGFPSHLRPIRSSANGYYVNGIYLIDRVIYRGPANIIPLDALTSLALGVYDE